MAVNPDIPLDPTQDLHAIVTALGKNREETDSIP